MKPKIDPKLLSVIEALKAQGFVLKGIANGFRVKLENGCDVDIYTLKSDPNHVRARLKTTEPDPDQRSKKIEEIYHWIAGAVRGVAEIHPFKLTKDMKNVFVYYAHIDISNTPAFHETLELRDEGAGPQGKEEERASTQDEEAELEVEEVEATGTLDVADESGPIEVTEVCVADDESQAEMVDFIDYTDFIEPARVSAEDAVSQLETVDPKMLRQALDSLSLPRSSNVRLVLTRLFRSAIDSEELEKSIRLEAEKINKSDDVEELKMIRDGQPADFLNPLIELLWNEVCGE